MIAIVSAVIVLGLGIIAYLLWWSVPTTKQKKEETEKTSLKGKTLEILFTFANTDSKISKMQLMEKLKIENSRLFFMLLKELEHKQLITIVDDNVEITDFGRMFYNNFIRQTNGVITF